MANTSKDLDLPTEPSDTDERWRYLPQRALLCPPDSGPYATELVKSSPRAPRFGSPLSEVETSARAWAEWIDALARRVRLGEVSPEQALTAASFAGEWRQQQRGAGLSIGAQVGGAALSQREADAKYRAGRGDQ